MGTSQNNGFLNFSNELSELALTVSNVECDTTLYREGDNGEEESDDDWNDDTTFIDSTKQVTWERSVCVVATLEVCWVTKHKLEECYTCNKADNNDPNRCANTLEALLLLSWGCFL